MKELMAEIHENAFGTLRRSDMTLRDWFAGQVISSVKAWHQADKRGKSSAAIAYEIADDMLKERSKSGER